MCTVPGSVNCPVTVACAGLGLSGGGVSAGGVTGCGSAGGVSALATVLAGTLWVLSGEVVCSVPAGSVDGGSFGTDGGSVCALAGGLAVGLVFDGSSGTGARVRVVKDRKSVV